MSTVMRRALEGGAQGFGEPSLAGRAEPEDDEHPDRDRDGSRHVVGAFDGQPEKEEPEDESDDDMGMSLFD